MDIIRIFKSSLISINNILFFVHNHKGINNKHFRMEVVFDSSFLTKIVFNSIIFWLIVYATFYLDAQNLGAVRLTFPYFELKIITTFYSIISALVAYYYYSFTWVRTMGSDVQHLDLNLMFCLFPPPKIFFIFLCGNGAYKIKYRLLVLGHCFTLSIHSEMPLFSVNIYFSYVID